MNSSLMSHFLVGLFSAILGGVVAGYFAVHYRTGPIQTTFDAIDVKRINVVEDDGSYALVLANSQNLPGVIRNGEERSPDQRKNVGGILYYNAKGDEVGGLITNRSGRENRVDGGVQLSMDQLNDQGQTIALMHWINGDFVRSALRVWDLPTDKPYSTMNENARAKEARDRLAAAESEEEAIRLNREYQRVLGEEGLWAERIYLGSEGEGARQAMLEIKDSQSQPRIRLIVDEQDRPRIEMLDENGAVVRSWSEGDE